jgi:hypothetical protein
LRDFDDLIAVIEVIFPGDLRTAGLVVMLYDLHHFRAESPYRSRHGTQFRMIDTDFFLPFLSFGFPSPPARRSPLRMHRRIDPK